MHMKEKVLNFIKANKFLIIAVLAIIVNVLLISSVIHTFVTKPDTPTTIRNNKPRVDFSFDMDYQDCMFNSKVCDPQERHMDCLRKTK